MKLNTENDAVFDFLTAHGFSPDFEEVAADWSARQYFRVVDGEGKPAILMVCLDDAQRALMQSFITIAGKLRDVGLSAPEIYAQNLDAGFMLLEDFGNQEFAQLIEKEPQSSEGLYGLAGEVLVTLRSQPEMAEGLPDYFSTAVAQGHVRVLDWYVPTILKQQIEPLWRDEYQEIWKNIEAGLPEPQTGFVHIDYHPANLMLMTGKAGLNQCGILDFQNACRGPIAYDYTNLLKDIRHDVPQDVQEKILQLALENMSEDEQQSFKAWYDVLALQFHFRIAGQVIKLALETGRDDLLEFLPRTLSYIREELQNPFFTELKTFFEKAGVDFNQSDISPHKKHISEPAF